MIINHNIAPLNTHRQLGANTAKNPAKTSKNCLQVFASTVQVMMGLVISENARSNPRFGSSFP